MKHCSLDHRCHDHHSSKRFMGPTIPLPLFRVSVANVIRDICIHINVDVSYILTCSSIVLYGMWTDRDICSETGRFQNIPREFRLCTMCNDNVIEDETHFIFYCSQYNDLREYLYEKIHPKYQHFEILSDAEIFYIVMFSVFVKHTAEYLYKAYARDVH